MSCVFLHCFSELRYALLLPWRIDLPLGDGFGQTAPALARWQEDAIFGGDFAETVSTTLQENKIICHRGIPDRRGVLTAERSRERGSDMQRGCGDGSLQRRRRLRRAGFPARRAKSLARLTPP
jgi:hypothetical protein